MISTLGIGGLMTAVALRRRTTHVATATVPHASERGLGTVRITAIVDDERRGAARFFDQALTLLRLQPRAGDPAVPARGGARSGGADAAMGIALAYGPNINDFEMDRDRAKTADEYAKKALALTSPRMRRSARMSRRSTKRYSERSGCRSEAAAGRLQGRDGGARQGVSVGSRRAGPLRREPDGSASVAVVGRATDSRPT